jgi:tRNA nucleotidyltransferase (CCA-adding enzyme)
VISGYDLMNWANQKSGPWIKETLEKIEKAIINKEIDNDKSKIKEWLFP